jgi:hypothetical protein
MDRSDMDTKLIHISGWFNIIGAGLLAVWWFGIFVFIGDHVMKADFVAVVQDPAWIPLNLIGIGAVFLLVIGVFGIYLVQADKGGKVGLIGFILAAVSLIWFGAIQYYETLFWPVIAANSSDLFNMLGIAPTNKLMFVMFMLSGILLLPGFIMLGIGCYRSGRFPKWSVILFAAGMILFGLGGAPLLRTIGIIPLIVGLITFGAKMVQE